MQQSTTTIKDDAARWAQVTAGSIMCKEILSVPLGTTARELEQILIESEVSGVAVVDNRGKIVGICSWRDVMAAFAANTEDEPHRPHDFFRFIDGRTMDFSCEVEIAIDDAITAADVMNTDLLTISESANIKDLASMMTEHHVHRLLVLNEASEIIGLVSTTDILNALSV